LNLEKGILSYYQEKLHETLYIVNGQIYVTLWTT